MTKIIDMDGIYIIRGQNNNRSVKRKSITAIEGILNVFDIEI